MRTSGSTVPRRPKCAAEESLGSDPSGSKANEGEGLGLLEILGHPLPCYTCRLYVNKFSRATVRVEPSPDGATWHFISHDLVQQRRKWSRRDLRSAGVALAWSRWNYDSMKGLDFHTRASAIKISVWAWRISGRNPRGRRS